MRTWTLVEATDMDCIMDESGVYTIISRLALDYGCSRGTVRADLMRAEGDEPLVSFIGSANNVRKRLILWILQHWPTRISSEHASYIGYELMRAESDPDYVQD